METNLLRHILAAIGALAPEGMLIRGETRDGARAGHGCVRLAVPGQTERRAGVNVAAVGRRALRLRA